MREKKQVWERGCYPGATLWATLKLPCSLPGTYPGVQGSGNKMGDSEVHGPRATTSLAPAESPREGA